MNNFIRGRLVFKLGAILAIYLGIGCQQQQSKPDTANTEAQLRAAAEAKRRADETKRRIDSAFAAMTPAQHLHAAEAISKGGLNGDIPAASRHLSAIPSAAPEAAQGQKLRRHLTVLQHLSEAQRLIAMARSAKTPEAIEYLRQADSHLRSVRSSSPKDEQAAMLTQEAAEVANEILARDNARLAEQSKQHPQETLAQVKCEGAVTHNLKSPRTANFESVPRVQDAGGWQYKIDSYVDAENNFGGHPRTYYTCKVRCTDIDVCAVTSLKFR